MEARSPRDRPGVRSAIVAFALLVASCGGGTGAQRTDTGAAAPASTPAASEAQVASASAAELAPDSVLGLVDSADGPLLLDVRSPEEYAAGHIPGAVNIPYDQLPDRLSDVAGWRERGIVVYCRTGHRAGLAEKTLLEAGFPRVWDLEGHMTAWTQAGRPTTDPVPCC